MRRRLRSNLSHARIRRSTRPSNSGATVMSPMPDHELGYLNDANRKSSVTLTGQECLMAPVADNYDIVIIGGGHNGLTCACYLARAGLSVRVLERRGIVGGSAVTEEFHPGFRNSVASYAVSLLNPVVIRDMELARHGLRIVLR